MTKTHASEEVRILQFFEEAAIEKVELLFHIVAEKVRLRLEAGHTAAPQPRRSARRPVQERDAPPVKAKRLAEAEAPPPGE